MTARRFVIGLAALAAMGSSGPPVPHTPRRDDRGLGAASVHMPDGNGPLSHGQAEFMALPGVEVRPWSGMRDAIEIAGPLTPAARDLFVRLEPSIESFDPEHKLWDYELVQDGMVVLSIGDYHDLQIDVPS
jgi:hypothetical protein